MTERERLRALVDALSNAPVDDEPLTEEDLVSLREAWEDLAQGRLISHEEIRRRFLGSSIEPRERKRL